MQCTKPNFAYRRKLGPDKNTGKWPLTFSLKHGLEDTAMPVPCGKCMSCRLEKSRQWAVRCVHEAKMWDQNCFLTLTYDNDNVPKDGSLIKKDIQNFMKKLREHERRKNGKTQIRHYLCGEYGDVGNRPHYHVCLFNHDFQDKQPSDIAKLKNRFSKYDGEYRTYLSEELDDLWKNGFSSIGPLTFETAAYTARYVTKKIGGPKAKDHYNGKTPEFSMMSRRPGIGATFYQKYKKDMQSIDKVIIKKGLQTSVPRYYNKLWEKEKPEQYSVIRERRIKKTEPFTFKHLKKLDTIREINHKKTEKRSKVL